MPLTVGRIARQFRTYGAGGGAGSGVDALTNLVAYYKLDESSGTATAVDATGRGNDLTTIGGTPTAPNGIIGKGMGMAAVANTRKAKANPSGGDLDLSGSSWEICFWLYLNAFVSGNRMLGRDSGGSARQYGCQTTGTTQLSIRIFDGTSTTLASVNATLSGPTGQWNFVNYWCDLSIGTYGTLFARVNNGTQVSNALTAAMGTNTQAFEIGSPNTPINGIIDEVLIYKGRNLNAATRTYLYNGGAGVQPL